jgi:hypothetical protein
MSRGWRAGVLAAVVVVSLKGTAIAQVTNGEVIGKVTDQTTPPFRVPLAIHGSSSTWCPASC